MGELILATVVGLVVVAMVVAFGLGALAVRRNAKKQLRVAKGVKSRAPANWVGAHSPEAKLHRRMVAAVSRLREAGRGDRSPTGSLALVEAEAVAIDEALVEAAALDSAAKADALIKLYDVVSSLESIVDRAVSAMAATGHRDHDGQSDSGAQPVGGADLERKVNEMDDRLRAIRAAYAELDSLEAPDVGQTADQPGSTGTPPTD